MLVLVLVWVLILILVLMLVLVLLLLLCVSQALRHTLNLFGELFQLALQLTIRLRGSGASFPTMSCLLPASPQSTAQHVHALGTQLRDTNFTHGGVEQPLLPPFRPSDTNENGMILIACCSTSPPPPLSHLAHPL